MEAYVGYILKALLVVVFVAMDIILSMVLYNSIVDQLDFIKMTFNKVCLSKVMAYVLLALYAIGGFLGTVLVIVILLWVISI